MSRCLFLILTYSIYHKNEVLTIGIGGFVVKIRGNRRRQDLLHMDSELLRTKNKRLRKTILEEHMPPEMQVNKLSIFLRIVYFMLDLGSFFWYGTC